MKRHTFKLDGIINPDYEVPPKISIHFLPGSTFKGRNISGQVVDNIDCTPKQFYYSKCGRIILVDITESKEEEQLLNDAPLSDIEEVIPVKYISLGDIPGSCCPKEEFLEAPIIGQDDYEKDIEFCVIL